ncbi:MAG: hypothetical protein R3E32_11530 [Chitinophagales bacterium]
MPDGDIIHSKLSGRYQKPYKLLCEDKLDNEICADAIIMALKKDIQKIGNTPIDSLKKMALLIEAKQNMIHNRQIHPLTKELETILKGYTLSTKIREILMSVSHSIIHECKYGFTGDVNDIQKKIVEKYMTEIYETSFKSILETTSSHYEDADNTMIQRKIQEITPLIKDTIIVWAHKSNSTNSVEKLRKLSRKKVSIDLKEDLLQ